MIVIDYNKIINLPDQSSCQQNKIDGHSFLRD